MGIVSSAAAIAARFGPATPAEGPGLMPVEPSASGALGGRAAEEVVFGSQTTGAENDMQQATEIVRQMVTRWGMSKAVGPVTLAPRESPFLGGGSELVRNVLLVVPDRIDDPHPLLDGGGDQGHPAAGERFGEPIRPVHPVRAVDLGNRP